MATTNIMIVGVGGQGTLLTSRILGKLATNAGYDVKLSEVHGMAQRGGSVVTYVRYGEAVAEPIVEEGQVDVLIAFEKLEALRYLHFVKKDGVIIVNDQRIDPMTVVTGAATYPENIIENLSKEYKVVAVIYHIKYNKKHIIMAMVADGLGGHEKGEMASQLVANQVIRWFQQKVINNISELNSEHIVKELRNLAMQLNTRLYDAGQKDNLKMGTTLSLIIICENNYIYMNIGDSRIYMVGKSAIKITEDQSIWDQRTETRAM